MTKRHLSSAQIEGNLTVNGTSTTLNTTNVSSTRLNITGSFPPGNTSNGLLQIGTLPFVDKNIFANFKTTIDDYAQIIVQNTSAGTSASSDIVINNDTGGASANYVDLGMNSSGFTGATPWDQANGGYLYANGGTFTIGTQGSNDLRLVTGNTIRATIDTNGTFTIPTNASGSVNALTLSGTPSATAVARGMLQVGSTLSTGAQDSNILASFVTDIGSYTQVIIQNKNAGATASSDFIVNNNNSGAATIYGDFGINSSGWAGTSPFDLANEVYLYSIGTDLVVGTRSAHNAIIATNDITRLTVTDTASTFSNRIVTFTASSSTVAPLTIPHLSAGTAPGTLNNGDIWTTTAGLFARINGATVGPFTSGGVSASANNTFTGQNTFSAGNQVFSYSTVSNSSVPALFLSGTPKTGTPLNTGTGLLQVGPLATGLADTNIVSVFHYAVNDYSQSLFINSSTGTAASVDICLYNDQTLLKGGLGSYADIGLSSSTYTTNSSWPSFSDPGGMYIYMQGGSLSIGTQHVGDAAPTTYTNDLMINTDDLTRVTLWGGRSGGTSYWTFESNLTGVQVNTTLFSSTLRTLATAATSTNSSAITIQSGNATGTTSSSGSVTIDTGTGTTAAGTITIGTTNAPTITIGKTTGSANTLAGNVVAYPANATTTTATSSAGYMGMPQILNPTSPYTLLASDAGKHIYFSTGTNTLTIPANGTTAFPIGTTIVIANASATATTIQITTDTLRLAGTTSTGSRSLNQYGVATLIKISATEWWISGNGVV